MAALRQQLHASMESMQVLPSMGVLPSLVAPRAYAPTPSPQVQQDRTGQVYSKDRSCSHVKINERGAGGREEGKEGRRGRGG
jgi:hypothetical protein